jgi:uncharacterized protein YjdB
MRTTHRPAFVLLAVAAAMMLIWPGLAVAAPTTKAAPAALPALLAAQLTDVPTLNITLPPGYNLDYVHASKDNLVPKDPATEPHSTLSVVNDADPTQNLTDVTLSEFKGRGNWTWTLPKRPYQFKFDTKTGILGLPVAKTWILLANMADTSLLRNKLAYDLGVDLGIPNSPHSRFVDLVVNGDYLGNYLLTEKIQVGTNRLELTDPQGVLMELDNNYGTAEDWYFYTKKSNTLFVLKDAASSIAKKPAVLVDPVKTAYADIQTKIDAFEDLLYAQSPDWASISALIDVDSFAKYYFVQETAANPEITQSSVYFYQNGPTDKIHAGPIWDFDSAFGSYVPEDLGGVPTQDYVKNARALRNMGNGWFSELFRIPEFVNQVNAIYTSTVKPRIDAVVARLGAYEAAMPQSAAKNFQKWNLLGQPSLFRLAGREGHTVASTWAGEVEYLRQWLSTRVAHLDGTYGAPGPFLRYQAHVAGLGWQTKALGVTSPALMTSGQIVGTTGQSRAVEAINLSLEGNGLSGAIQNNTHVSMIGWQGWNTSTQMGTTGRGLGIEAIQLKLTGGISGEYDIEYRAHVASVGWQGWVKNGATAGTTGRSLSIEALQIRLVKRTTPTPVASVTYKGHVATIGWMASVKDGAVAGTTGRSLALEAVQVNVSGLAGGIEYRAHVSTIGWMPWTTSANFVGTTGRSLAMEAVEIRLTGDLATRYDIQYSAHVADIGWMGWVSNGQTGGTTGQSRRMEAIMIKLVAK